MGTGEGGEQENLYRCAAPKTGSLRNQLLESDVDQTLVIRPSGAQRVRLAFLTVGREKKR